MRLSERISQGSTSNLLESIQHNLKEDDITVGNILWDDYNDYSDEEKQEIVNLINNIDLEATKNDGHSVLIKDKNSDLEFWIDYTEKDGDIFGDWNQYIFDMTNHDDKIKKAVQTVYIADTNESVIFDEAETEGFHYLEQSGIVEDTGNGYKFIDETVDECDNTLTESNMTSKYAKFCKSMELDPKDLDEVLEALDNLEGMDGDASGEYQEIREYIYNNLMK